VEDFSEKTREVALNLACCLFEKLNPCQPGNAGQFRLGGIARDEHLGADVLGGGDVDKIPGAGGGVGGVTRAQFIAPFQKIGQTLDTQLHLIRPAATFPPRAEKGLFCGTFSQGIRSSPVGSNLKPWANIFHLVRASVWFTIIRIIFWRSGKC
jgi:hypothetical protein